MNRCLVAIVFFVLLANRPHEADAKTLFEDLCEMPEVAATWTTTYTSAGGTIAPIGTPVHSGRASLKSYLPTTAGSHCAIVVRTYSTVGAGPDPVYSRFFFYIAPDCAVPDGGTVNIGGFSTEGFGGRLNAQLKNKSGSLVISLAPGGDGTTKVTPNTWHCLDLSYKTGGSNGEARAWLDGVQTVVATGLALPAVNQAGLGCEAYGSASGTVFFDDMTVSDAPLGQPGRECRLVHADFFGHLGMKITAILIGRQDGDRLTATLTGKNGYSAALFDKNSGLSGFETFTFDLRSLTADTYTLTARLSDASGAGLDTVRETFTKPYNGIPAVGIDENNAICKNGTPIFPVTPFGLDRPLVHTWTANHDINSFFTGGFDLPFTVANYRGYLDSAVANSLYGSFGPGRDDSWPRTQAGGYIPSLTSVANYVTTLRNHPGVFMWNWMDEAITENGMAPETVATWTAKCHELDPQHPVILNEAGYIDQHASDYMIAQATGFFYPHLPADVLCFDYYPIENGAGNGDDFEGMAVICDRYRTWNWDQVPFMSFIETCDIGGTGRPAPTPDQLRMSIWLNVVHGAKGISWFHYFSQTPAANFTVMGAFTQQMARLAPVVLSREPRVTVTDNANTRGSRVDELVRIKGDSLYIFAVRVTEYDEAGAAPLPTTFSIAGLGAATATVVDESRTVSVVNGALSDAFAPNAVHIYRIPGVKEAVRGAAFPGHRPAGYALKGASAFTGLRVPGGEASLSIYTASGRLVRRIRSVDGNAVASSTAVPASGIYLARVRSQGPAQRALVLP